MAQVFVSHTLKDKNFCDDFDRVCARVGIKAFRSEFEKLSVPAWKTVKDAMNKSTALFFLVGKELTSSQELNEPEWRYTQNWIAYEVGLACQLSVDVWAICDDVLINFPMPYINNYLTVTLKDRNAFDLMRLVLEKYNEGVRFPFPLGFLGITCPYKDCKMEFNLHSGLIPGSIIRCPQCLKNITFHKGHPEL